jgi:uncharacterized ferritin-like protein (DUF455 family)
MTYDEVKLALDAAEEAINQAERFAKRGVEMARGKLRHIGISSYVLADLKRELQNFDMHKMRWK